MVKDIPFFNGTKIHLLDAVLQLKTELHCPMRHEPQIHQNEHNTHFAIYSIRSHTSFS